MVGTGAVVATPVVVRRIVDRAIVHHEERIGPWLVLLVVLAILRGVLVWARRWFGGRVSIDAEADLRRALHDHLQTLDPLTHDALSQGQVVSRANADVSMISQLLAFLPLLSSNVVQLVLSMVVMALLSPLLTLIVLTMVPLLGATSLWMRRRVYASALDAQQRQGDLAAHVDEAIVGVRVVKGFGQEHRELTQLEQEARDLYASRVRNLRLTARYTPILQTVPAIALVALLLVGGHFVIDGRIGVGTFLAFATYLGQLVAPIRMAGLLFTVGQAARAGAERVFELLDYAPRITDAPDAIALERGPGELRFESVTFSYLRDQPVVQEMDLVVAPGETVALAGASGSGKSTVAMLLPRFHDPTSGAVRIDGTDVRTVTLTSLRNRIGVVFDDAFLFSSSIRENIAYGRPDATDEQVRSAARMAEAERFVEALPHGYDTVVGEQGLTLSGGQRQRISLARALLSDPDILVLDDATSALDVRTEAEIHETLRQVMKGRTTVLVAHRKSTLLLADRVVVLEQGRIIDQGPHDELLERCQAYRLLLSGPGEGAEGEAGSPEPARPVAAPNGAATTSSAGAVAAAGARASSPVARGPVQGMPVGGGIAGMGGGMAGGGGFGVNPSEKALARIASLPPADDRPPVDPHEAVSVAERSTDGFSLRSELRPHRLLLWGGIGLVVVDAILSLLGPRFIEAGLSNGVRGASVQALHRAVAWFVAVVIVDLFVMRWSALVVGLVGERLLYGLRLRVFAHLQRLALDFYEREMTGRILTRVTGDIDALAGFVQQGVVNLVLNLLTVVGVAAVLVSRNVELGLVSLCALPPLLVATAWFRRASSRAYGAVRERVAGVNAALAESFSGVRVVQAYGREDRNTREFAAIVEGHRQARLDGQRAASTYFPVVEALGVLATALVLWVGSGMVHDGRLTAATLVAFVLYLTQLFAPVQQLTVVLDTWQQAGAATDKLAELLEERTTTPPPVSPETLPPRAASGPRGARLVLEGVRFAYRGSADEALRGVDLVIEAGETVSLVGETGAGKSTVVKLLVRYYDPTAGRVLVDGVDLRTVDPGDWHRRLGVVPQEAVLFSGSIAANIAYGRPEATMAEIERAARAVGAHDLVLGLPDGYDTVVSARGRSLSSGQRQLIALARAALVDPQVLLLDEATANVDLASEARVQAAMGVLSRDRTTVIVAHRLETARRADRIVVLADGCVAEQGTHEELLAAGGAYAHLWATAAAH